MGVMSFGRGYAHVLSIAKWIFWRFYCIVYSTESPINKDGNVTSTVRASYADAGMVRVLMVPPWVSNPTVLPRQDGEDIITVEVTRRSSRREQWLIAGGASISVAVAFCLLCEEPKVVREADVRMTVYAPLHTYADLRTQPIPERR